MMWSDTTKVFSLHAIVIGLLLALQFVLPEYHHNSVARVMVLATYAMGYNILFGYTGLLSLGHAMFFGAGMYGVGLTVWWLDFSPLEAFGAGILASLVLALLVGIVALRTTGVSFLIVTMMLAQAGYLAAIYFKDITSMPNSGSGLVISSKLRPLEIGSYQFNLSHPDVRYNTALVVFSVCLLACLLLSRSPIGRILIAIRENESRTLMLGYDTFKYKLLSLVISGVMAGVGGATYALLFSFVGITFLEIQYSIHPLLWTLLGGIGTTIGPLVGTVLMYYLIDISSGLFQSYFFVVGAVLLIVVLWFRQGIVGTIRSKWISWLP